MTTSFRKESPVILSLAKDLLSRDNHCLREDPSLALRMTKVSVLAVLLWFAAAAATAQSPQAQPSAGTVIVGDQESAVGLYLLPWQEEQASDIDRPPSLFDVPARPVDPQQFKRRVQYEEAALAWRHERLFRSR